MIEADDNLTLDGASRSAGHDRRRDCRPRDQKRDADIDGRHRQCRKLSIWAAQKQKVILCRQSYAETGAGCSPLGDSGDTLVDNGSATTLTIDNTVAGVGAISDSELTLTISQARSRVATPPM